MSIHAGEINPFPQPKRSNQRAFRGRRRRRPHTSPTPLPQTTILHSLTPGARGVTKIANGNFNAVATDPSGNIYLGT